MTQQKTLDDLLVSEDDLNEELLTEVLAPYVRIGDDSGAFIPTDEFESLQSTEKVAVFLLYRKAAYELGLADDEGATPLEVTEASGINHNTVKGAVRELDEENLVQNEDGEYSVPAYGYDSVQELIRGD